jgi:hypothetical protein
MPGASNAQSDAVQIADAARAQIDSMKLVHEQEQAVYDAKNARTSRILWIIGIIGMSSYAAFWLYSKRNTIMGVVRAFTGGFRIKGDATTPEAKKILVGAMYSDQQGAYLNTLETGIDDAKRNTILGEWWGITDTESAESKLDYLRDEGFGFYFPAVYKALLISDDDERKEIIITAATSQEMAQKAYSQTHNLLDSIETLQKEKVIETVSDIEKYGVLGWDAGRLTFIARLCCDARYIDSEQALQYIDAAYRKAQRAFDSWEALSKSYIIGRAMWGGGDVANDGMVYIAENLLQKPDSPWVKVAWK